jgi:hypothetical protein
MAYQNDEMQLVLDLKRVVSELPDQNNDIVEQVLQTLHISYDEFSYRGYKQIITIILNGEPKAIVDDIQAYGYNDLFQHFQKKLHRHCINLRFPVGRGIRLSDENLEDSRKIRITEELIDKKRDFLESVKALIPERIAYQKALEEYREIEQIFEGIPNCDWALDKEVFDKNLQENLQILNISEEGKIAIFLCIKQMYELKKLMMKFEQHIEDVIELDSEIQDRKSLIPRLEGISKIFESISDMIPSSSFKEHRCYIEKIKNGEVSNNNLYGILIGYFTEFLHLVKRMILDLSVTVMSAIEGHTKKRPVR